MFGIEREHRVQFGVFVMQWNDHQGAAVAVDHARFAARLQCAGLRRQRFPALRQLLGGDRTGHGRIEAGVHGGEIARVHRIEDLVRLARSVEILGLRARREQHAEPQQQSQHGQQQRAGRDAPFAGATVETTLDLADDMDHCNAPVARRIASFEDMRLECRSFIWVS
ncbi:MAG: hypothetical protein HOP03_14570 [Lysobacter sp.]|nr:hypothetical protein [Lysobacter sp.]